MTNEYIEELTQVATELNELIRDNRFYSDWSKLAHVRAKIRILNDLVRKINEELD